MSGCRAAGEDPQFGAMGEARAFTADSPWVRRRRRPRRGLRALPLRVLALLSLGLVGAAVWWMVEQWRLSQATVPKVAALATGLPQESAPKPVEGMPGVLARAGETIAVPHRRPIGARRDEIAGRAAVTVYYARGERQLRYTIVSGAGDVQNDTATTTRTVLRGPLALSFVGGVAGTLTLAFERRDRTVVLTAPGAKPEFGQTMLRLATWRAGGRLAF
jgi:hypothetical protein